MAETLFEELKRYVAFGEGDEQALRALHPLIVTEFPRIADVFYQRILEHEGARRALEGGESKVGRLKVTLVAWMETLLKGPWNEAYFQLRCRIGRLHVRISLPQHYMFGAMNVIRRELIHLVDRNLHDRPDELHVTRAALAKILDLELAIMLHTYREDLLAQQARHERLSTFGQLVGSIGHELRNPLGVIETSMYILRSRAGNDERTRKHLDRVSEQLGIANRIISDLLDMIRDRPLNRQSIPLLDVVESAVEAVARPAGVELQVVGITDLPEVNGDWGQLRQVFINLLENAVHAASPTGNVRIWGEVADDAAWITVQDSGPGVDEAIRARLFEPLITNKEKGIGLGLALVKRILERHDGTIWYEPAVGGGARFVMRLPLSR